MNVTPPQRHWLTIVVLAAAAVVLAAIALVVAVTRGADESAPAGALPTATPSGSTSPATGTAAPSKSPEPAAFAYQPLFPFAGTGEADAWVRQARPGGHQPWHDDPGTVALMFTQQHLGYTSLDKVTSSLIQGEQAWIGVGFENPNGAPATAAVLHLVRIGTAPNGPCEVVGTEDTTLALTTPAYAASVGSPVQVGGRITGVDESLQVQVRGGNGPQPAGSAAPVPAGGTNTPWTVSVPFTAICPATLTVAVATGGHVAEIERFAVTGVKC
ncbi:hypothetical protein [Nocardia brasiliensis]|uniref:Uncharacterized protein n=1 Tax=Nocardia brasiliensis (strain ATCC 700358 / HUJEG-1) TaxID=1133849 RepID=K0F1N8_NOCB7|nr:hypothetical protein [Nocardia brasiliensis]AFU01581.1 hypothetical protein O3I_018110 [Nocardia brasiliensis ATCC 700358]OCF85840.1 hypothetical protein AW168_33860 [Nocardia brasiliensis]